ncbi:hypothetical protein D9619_012016 [Psilocybe cf. subviscida]|uniref:Reverse transcriptase domain-containing protein n=1 Tax=Psilocybe cf. subviscida TaxID=2480587 RepID=A0A8H5B798_9AGAR|nr:hypothetical protein D9619_012016 [Psilocybe cf. subviscida]
MDPFGFTRTNPHYLTVYPPTNTTNHKATRSVILVSRNLDSNAHTNININWPDVTAVQLSGDFGTIRIINIYNNCENNNSLTAVAKYLREPRARHCERLPLSYIWLGDFNRHHPSWDEERNHHMFTESALALAQPLLDMTGIHNMHMALPKDIPTLRASNGGNLTRVDNVFCSEDLLTRIIECDAHPHLQPVKADHFPIITIMDIEVDEVECELRPNFRMTNWEAFCEALSERLEGLTVGEIVRKDDLKERVQVLDEAVAEVIAAKVPMSQPVPTSKRWWTTELGKMKKAMKKLGRKSHQHHWEGAHPVHERYRRSRNDYSEAIRQAKAEHWEAWLDGLDEKTVWDAGRLLAGTGTDGGRTRVPALKIVDARGRVEREAVSNEEKGKAFFEAFFLGKPNESLVPADARYPAAAWNFQNITDPQIHQAIRKLKPYKASRTGTPPNSVMQHARDLLVPHLGPIFRATYTLKYYPTDWARTETLVIRKPGRADYALPGAWRPIVLSHGFAKLLNSCQTEDVVAMCEAKGLLPANHFGGRPGCTTTDSLHLLAKTIKDAWRSRKVASVLYLDVKGAFPSVSIDRLIHDMRMIGVPVEITNWMRRRLARRKTALVFDDYQTPTFVIENGLDQGDPYSGICYIIYNSSLLRLSIRRRGVLLLLFIDDVAIMVVGVTFEETNAMLKEIMEGEGGVLEWAREHNCSFGIEKFQKVDHWKGRLTPAKQSYDLVIETQTIKTKQSARFLGVLVDRKLDWKEQGAAAIQKGQAWVTQYTRVAKMTRGARRATVRNRPKSERSKAQRPI